MSWRGGQIRVALTVGVVLAACQAAAGPAGAEAARPLTVRSVLFAPGEITRGGDFAVAGTLRNRTDAALTRIVRAFVRGGDGRFRVGARRLTVGAHSRRAFTLAASVPDGLDGGAYAVAACVRARGQRSCRRGNGKLIVPPAPPEPPPPPPPDYGPGARTLGDPLFPEVGNGGYDAQHYDVELHWTAANAFVAGTEVTMTAEATEDLSELSMDLEGLTVGPVAVNGVPADAVTRVAPAACSGTPPCAATKLVITPADPIDEGEEFAVRVSYTGTPMRHTDPDGSDEGWTDTADGAFVVNEPIGAMTWMPVNNHPLDKATYEFGLTVPTGRTAIGNGEQPAAPVVNGDGTTTWSWAMEQPMSTYLSTSTVGNFDFVEATTPQGLIVQSFIESSFTPAEKALAQTTVDRQEEIVDYFTTLYGAYPFDSTGVVVDEADVGYALEVQTKSHFPSAVVDPVILAHEVAHQWFGDSVTLSTWKDIWLNEGWADWSEWQWDFEENNGLLSPADQFDANYTPGAGSCPSNKWCAAPADPTAETMFTTFPTYTRPAMMLEALRQIIGTGRFYELARSWHADHRYGHGTTAQFIALAKQKSGLSGANLTKLDTFFQQWLFGTTMPTITGANFYS
jgi:aminopeptidase N